LKIVLLKLRDWLRTHDDIQRITSYESHPGQELSHPLNLSPRRTIIWTFNCQDSAVSAFTYRTKCTKAERSVGTLYQAIASGSTAISTGRGGREASNNALIKLPNVLGQLHFLDHFSYVLRRRLKQRFPDEILIRYIRYCSVHGKFHRMRFSSIRQSSPSCGRRCCAISLPVAFPRPRLSQLPSDLIVQAVQPFRYEIA
jgi:hypothetical protein